MPLSGQKRSAFDVLLSSNSKSATVASSQKTVAPSGSRFVACPSCGKSFSLLSINAHIDSCVGSSTETATEDCSVNVSLPLPKDIPFEIDMTPPADRSVSELNQASQFELIASSFQKVLPPRAAASAPAVAPSQVLTGPNAFDIMSQSSKMLSRKPAIMSSQSRVSTGNAQSSTSAAAATAVVPFAVQISSVDRVDICYLSQETGRRAGDQSQSDSIRLVWTPLLHINNSNQLSVDLTLDNCSSSETIQSICQIMDTLLDNSACGSIDQWKRVSQHCSEHVPSVFRAVIDHIAGSDITDTTSSTSVFVSTCTLKESKKANAAGNGSVLQVLVAHPGLCQPSLSVESNNLLPASLGLRIPTQMDTSILSPSSESSPWYGSLSASMLKSALQKNIRLSRPDAAVRVALKLARQCGIDELLRRLFIIMIEDACLHPYAPFLMSLILFASKKAPMLSHNMHTQLNPIYSIIFQMVWDFAKLPFKDSMPESEEIVERSISLLDVDRLALTDWQRMTLTALLARACFGGMGGDVDLLRRSAAIWLVRFTQPRSACRCLEQQSNSLVAMLQHQTHLPCMHQVIPTLLRPQHPSPLPLQLTADSCGWLHILSAHVHSAALKEPLSKQLGDGDLPLSCIDFHCSDMLEALLVPGNTARTRIVQFAAQTLRWPPPPWNISNPSKSIDAFVKTGNSDSAWLQRYDQTLRECVWYFRSSLTDKWPMNDALAAAAMQRASGKARPVWWEVLWPVEVDLDASPNLDQIRELFALIEKDIDAFAFKLLNSRLKY